jgi:peptidoglycan-N-acetylglucosamine deacetylase
VDEIVRRTLEGAGRGDGHVVLLHDSGGDRTQTVDALPGIIRGLRQEGFALVRLSDLMGLSHDAVMPPLDRTELMGAGLNDFGFQILRVLANGLHLLFFAGIVLGLIRLLLVVSLAVAQKRASSRARRARPAGAPPRVAVLVPAYNEEKVVVRTVDSLLASTHADLEVVVIDDGSTDGTLAQLERYREDPRVRVLRKPNGGKASALNWGLAHVDAPVVATVDADTLFQPETLSRLLAPLSDPGVVAVAGNAKVGNRINLVTRWQALEYVTSQNLDRRAFAQVNGISVVPGAVGAWRRDALRAVGGWPGDTLAEDADLTLAILRHGGRVAYADDAIALTEAPDSIRALARQRFRWMFGTLQAAWKHRHAMFRPSAGALGTLVLPNILLFQVVQPLVSPVLDLQMLVSLALAQWQRHQHPEDPPTYLLQILFYYALFVVMDHLAAAVAFALERTEQWGLLAWLFWQRFLYRQVMYVVGVRATVAALHGGLVGWGKLERHATVHT